MSRGAALPRLLAGVFLVAAVAVALLALVMQQRTRAERARFLEAYDSIALGVSARQAQVRMGGAAARKTELVEPPLSNDCRELPRRQLILSDESARFTAIFYLDGKDKVICSVLLGPLSD